MPAAKLAKAAVDYSRGGRLGRSQCGFCKHYESSACKLVEGDIAATDWCRLWRQRTNTSAIETDANLNVPLDA